MYVWLLIFKHNHRHPDLIFTLFSLPPSLSVRVSMVPVNREWILGRK